MTTDNACAEIEIESRDHILRIKINRPEKKNALTRSMYAAMAEERKHFSERLVSGESNEAFSAFFEGRKPDFSAFD